MREDAASYFEGSRELVYVYYSALAQDFHAGHENPASYKYLKSSSYLSKQRRSARFNTKRE